jgi:hypothetical protein
MKNLAGEDNEQCHTFDAAGADGRTQKFHPRFLRSRGKECLLVDLDQHASHAGQMFVIHIRISLPLLERTLS